jgi:hypothetical protein
MEKYKNFICPKCKKFQDSFGVIQKEIRYYKVFIESDQWEDFHGDEEVVDSEYFCLSCKSEIKEDCLFD